MEQSISLKDLVDPFIVDKQYPDYSTFNEYRVILVFKDGCMAHGACGSSQLEAEKNAYKGAYDYLIGKGSIQITTADAVIKSLRAINPIMDFFHYSHLPSHLQAVSKPIGDIAYLMHTSLPDSAEKSTGLRKLLEAKDCFVRCAVNNKDLKLDMGNISDGYHTFNELYAHRMNLFAVICHANQSHAWKSKLHHDGTMYLDYFIVGINTPQGQFTYHYHMDHWDLFKVTVLDNAPEWDTHTANDVTRLHSLTGGNIDELLNTRIPILDKIHDLCLAIEKCGASPEITEAVRLAGELRYPISDLVKQALALGIGQGIVSVSYSNE